MEKAPTERAPLSPLFIVVAAVFITALISANIIAVKLVVIAGEVLPAAIVIFPVSYIVGDVLTEVYGFRRARAVIWLGFLCNLLAVGAIWVGGLLPAAGFWQENEAAYETILGQTPRLLAASFAAYLVGELANSMVLARMKQATKGRWLWSRTIGSTVVGQGLDSAVFITIALCGRRAGPVAAGVGAVAGQGGLRGPGDARDLRRRRRTQAQGAHGRVRLGDLAQPPALLALAIRSP